MIDSAQEITISDVAIAETAHVLTTVYDMPRADVIDALIAFPTRQTSWCFASTKKGSLRGSGSVGARGESPFRMR